MLFAVKRKRDVRLRVRGWILLLVSCVQTLSGNVFGALRSGCYSTCERLSIAVRVEQIERLPTKLAMSARVLNDTVVCLWLDFLP